MNGILYITGALADGGVTTAKIADDAVTNAKIADNAVNADKIADNAIITSKIQGSQINNAHIASNAAIAGTKVNPEFGAQDITSTGASDIYLQLEKTGTRTWKAKYETNSTIAGNGPTLKITTDKNVGGAGEPGLGLYIDEDMHLHLWDDSQTLPTTMPHTAVRPTFSVYGDILVGDIIAIADNPMTYFMRVETGLDATKVTNFFCAKNGANDTDGGSTITMAPDQTGSVDSGYISLSAYGQGTGNLANSIRLQNRTSANTVADRAILNKDGNFGVGLTTGLTGRLSASNSTGTIGYFESTQAATNASNIVGNSTQASSSSNLVLQVNSGNTAQSIIRCNGNNDTVLLSGTSPAERVRFLAGGGITFNGDTAAANALDDYEEGSFTPSINPGFTVGYYTQFGRYVKIAKLVYFTLYVGVNTISGSSSATHAQIHGLPYASADYNGMNGYDVSVSWIYQLGQNVNNAYVQESQTYIQLLNNPTGGNREHTNANSCWDQNSLYIMCSGTYPVN